MENNENYFTKLSKIECEVEKRNNLSYISWANAWDEVKRVYPDATYEKIKNTNDNSYLFRSWSGWGVEVDVTINGITHRSDLAITWNTNQEIKYEAIKSTDIHNTLQRAFAKAIAMHGIGLYVYRWEDFPEETSAKEKKEVQAPKEDKKPGKSDTDTCPSCGLVCSEIKHWEKDWRAWHMANCECWEKFFIRDAFFAGKSPTESIAFPEDRKF